MEREGSMVHKATAEGLFNQFLATFVSKLKERLKRGGVVLEKEGEEVKKRRNEDEEEEEEENDLEWPRRTTFFLLTLQTWVNLPRPVQEQILELVVEWSRPPFTAGKLPGVNLMMNAQNRSHIECIWIRACGDVLSHCVRYGSVAGKLGRLKKKITDYGMEHCSSSLLPSQDRYWAQASLTWASLLGLMSRNDEQVMELVLNMPKENLNDLTLISHASHFLRLPVNNRPMVARALSIHAEILARARTDKSDPGKQLRHMELCVLDNLLVQLNFRELCSNDQSWEKTFEDLVFGEIYKVVEHLTKADGLKAASLHLMSTILLRSPEKHFKLHFAKFYSNRVLRHFSEGRKVKHSLEISLWCLRGAFDRLPYEWDGFAFYSPSLAFLPNPLKHRLRDGTLSESAKVEILENTFQEVFERTKSKALSWSVVPSEMFAHASEILGLKFNRNASDDTAVDVLFGESDISREDLYLSEDTAKICTLIVLQMAVHDVDFVVEVVLPKLLHFDGSNSSTQLNKAFVGLRVLWQMVCPFTHQFENSVKMEASKRLKLIELLQEKLAPMMENCKSVLDTHIEDSYHTHPLVATRFVTLRDNKSRGNLLPIDPTGKSLGRPFSWATMPIREGFQLRQHATELDGIRAATWLWAIKENTTRVAKAFPAGELGDKENWTKCVHGQVASFNNQLRNTPKKKKVTNVLGLYHELILCVPLLSCTIPSSPKVREIDLPLPSLLLHADWGIANAASYALQVIMTFASDDQRRVRVIKQFSNLIESCVDETPKFVKTLKTLLTQMILLLEIWRDERSSESQPMALGYGSSSWEWFSQKKLEWAFNLQSLTLALLCVPCRAIRGHAMQLSRLVKDLVSVYVSCPETCVSPFLYDHFTEQEIQVIEKASSHPGTCPCEFVSPSPASAGGKTPRSRTNIHDSPIVAPHHVRSHTAEAALFLSGFSSQDGLERSRSFRSFSEDNVSSPKFLANTMRPSRPGGDVQEFNEMYIGILHRLVDIEQSRHLCFQAQQTMVRWIHSLPKLSKLRVLQESQMRGSMNEASPRAESHTSPFPSNIAASNGEPQNQAILEPVFVSQEHFMLHYTLCSGIVALAGCDPVLKRNSPHSLSFSYSRTRKEASVDEEPPENWPGQLEPDVNKLMYNLWDCAVEIYQPMFSHERPDDKWNWLHIVACTTAGKATHPKCVGKVLELVLNWRESRLDTLRKLYKEACSTASESNSLFGKIAFRRGRGNTALFSSSPELIAAVSATVGTVSMKLLRDLAQNDTAFSRALQLSGWNQILILFKTFIKAMKPESLADTGEHLCIEFARLVYSFSRALQRFVCHGFDVRSAHELSDHLWARAERRQVWRLLQRLSGFSDMPLVIPSTADLPKHFTQKHMASFSNAVDRKRNGETSSSSFSSRELLTATTVAAIMLLGLGPVSLGAVAPPPDMLLWQWMYSNTDLQSFSGSALPPFLSAYLIAHWRVGDRQTNGGGTFIPFLDRFYEELEASIGTGPSRSNSHSRFDLVFVAICDCVQTWDSEIEPSAIGLVTFLALIQLRTNKNETVRRRSVDLVRAVVPRSSEFRMSQFLAFSQHENPANLHKTNAARASRYVAQNCPELATRIFSEFAHRLPSLAKHGLQSIYALGAIDMILPWCHVEHEDLDSLLSKLWQSSQSIYSEAGTQALELVLPVWVEFVYGESIVSEVISFLLRGLSSNDEDLGLSTSLLVLLSIELFEKHPHPVVNCLVQFLVNDYNEEFDSSSWIDLATKRKRLDLHVKEQPAPESKKCNSVLRALSLCIARNPEECCFALTRILTYSKCIEIAEPWVLSSSIIKGKPDEGPPSTSEVCHWLQLIGGMEAVRDWCNTLLLWIIGRPMVDSNQIYRLLDVFVTVRAQYSPSTTDDINFPTRTRLETLAILRVLCVSLESESVVIASINCLRNIYDQSIETTNPGCFTTCYEVATLLLRSFGFERDQVTHVLLSFLYRILQDPGDSWSAPNEKCVHRIIKHAILELQELMEHRASTQTQYTVLALRVGELFPEHRPRCLLAIFPGLVGLHGHDEELWNKTLQLVLQMPFDVKIGDSLTRYARHPDNVTFLASVCEEFFVSFGLAALFDGLDRWFEDPTTKFSSTWIAGCLLYTRCTLESSRQNFDLWPSLQRIVFFCASLPLRNHPFRAWENAQSQARSLLNIATSILAENDSLPNGDQQQIGLKTDTMKIAPVEDNDQPVFEEDSLELQITHILDSAAQDCLLELREGNNFVDHQSDDSEQRNVTSHRGAVIKNHTRDSIFFGAMNEPEHAENKQNRNSRDCIEGGVCCFDLCKGVDLDLSLPVSSHDKENSPRTDRPLPLQPIKRNVLHEIMYAPKIDNIGAPFKLKRTSQVEIGENSLARELATWITDPIQRERLCRFMQEFSAARIEWFKFCTMAIDYSRNPSDEVADEIVEQFFDLRSVHAVPFESKIRNEVLTQYHDGSMNEDTFDEAIASSLRYLVRNNVPQDYRSSIAMIE